MLATTAMAAHRSFPPSWYQASGLEGLWSVDSVDGIQVGNGIELEAVGLKFEPYRWAAVAPLWCDRDLGFFPNSSGNKAAENSDQHNLAPLRHQEPERLKSGRVS